MLSETWLGARQDTFLAYVRVCITGKVNKGKFQGPLHDRSTSRRRRDKNRLPAMVYTN